MSSPFAGADIVSAASSAKNLKAARDRPAGSIQSLKSCPTPGSKLRVGARPPSEAAARLIASTQVLARAMRVAPLGGAKDHADGLVNVRDGLDDAEAAEGGLPVKRVR